MHATDLANRHPPQAGFRRTLKRCAALLALLALVALAYMPGLEGPFVFDDFPNFVRDVDVQPASLGYSDIRPALYANDRDWPHRGLSYLSFAINFVLSGGRFDPLAMKATNVAIHLVNAWLVYLLFARIAKHVVKPGERLALTPYWFVLAAVGIWALHPLNLTSVLYTVQRMASLSTLCVLLGLNLYLLGRERFRQRPRSGVALMIAALVVACGVGPLFKENALLFLPLALLVESFCHSAGWRSSLPASGARRLATISAIVAGAIGVFAVSALIVLWAAGTYGGRDFDITQRLLTQSRALALYAQMFALPAPSVFGLHHDDFQISRNLLNPLSTLAAVGVWTGALAAAWFAARRQAVWVFGFLWFLVGHAMESTVFPLELVHEHRNYLPIVGPAFAVAYYVNRLSAATRAPAACASGILLVLLGLMGSVTAVRANQWSDRYSLMALGVVYHPESPRYNSSYAAALLAATGDIETAIIHFKKAAHLNPGDVSSLMNAYAHVENHKLQVAAYLGSLDDDALTQADATAPEDSPEHPAQAVLKRLKSERRELHDEVTQRLRSGTFSAETLTALMLLQQCVSRSGPECAGMKGIAFDWLDVALGNPTLGGKWRAQILFGRGVLDADTGLLEEAVQWWHRSLALEPNLPVVRLSLVDAYLALERPDAAREQLAEIVDLGALNARQRAQYEALRAHIERE